MERIKFSAVIFVSLVLIFTIAFGCKTAPPKATPVAVMDNPGHHFTTGLKKIDEGKLDDAMFEFKRANSLEPLFPLSFTGMGIVDAKRGNYAKGIEEAEKGLELAVEKGEEFDARVGLIRVYTEAGGKEWIEKVEEQFEKADKLSTSGESAYFFMGNAYRKALEFKKAEKMYRKVLDINKSYVQEADENLKVVQKIVRAAPGTEFGKKIALVPAITRADITALFVSELGLEKLLSRKEKNEKEPAFKTPQEFSQKAEEVKLPEDVVNHPLKSEIEVALKYGISGLEVSPQDRRFNPDKLITKADYSIMLEDLICRIEGNNDLKKKFLDSSSPYNDLRSDNYAFNSVMVCISKNLLDPEGDSEFGVYKPVSGADALLVIRKLKEELKL